MYRSSYAYNIQFVGVFCQYVKESKFNFQYVHVRLRKPFKIVHCVFLPHFQLIILHLNYYFCTAIS